MSFSAFYFFYFLYGKKNSFVTFVFKRRKTDLDRKKRKKSYRKEISKLVRKKAKFSWKNIDIKR